MKRALLRVAVIVSVVLPIALIALPGTATVLPETDLQMTQEGAGAVAATESICILRKPKKGPARCVQGLISECSGC